VIGSEAVDGPQHAFDELPPWLRSATIRSAPHLAYACATFPRPAVWRQLAGQVIEDVALAVAVDARDDEIPVSSECSPAVDGGIDRDDDAQELLPVDLRHARGLDHLAIP